VLALLACLGLRFNLANRTSSVITRLAVSSSPTGTKG
jgi:hypothetical protein